MLELDILGVAIGGIVQEDLLHGQDLLVGTFSAALDPLTPGLEFWQVPGELTYRHQMAYGQLREQGMRGARAAAGVGDESAYASQHCLAG